jgi:hypothetical protein
MEAEIIKQQEDKKTIKQLKQELEPKFEKVLNEIGKVFEDNDLEILQGLMVIDYLRQVILDSMGNPAVIKEANAVMIV